MSVLQQRRLNIVNRAFQDEVEDLSLSLLHTGVADTGSIDAKLFQLLREVLGYFCILVRCDLPKDRRDLEVISA